jgi:hypothetical protein
MGRMLAVRAYVACVASAALVSLFVAWRHEPPDSLRTLAVLAALCLLSEQRKVRLFAARTAMSTTAMVQLAAVAIAGPMAAMALGVVACLVMLGRPPRVWLLNSSLMVLTGGGAGAAYLLAGGAAPGTPPQSPTGVLAHLVLPLMAADVVMCLVNAAVLAGVISISQRVGLRQVLVGTLVNGSVVYVGYGLFGVLLAVLWDAAQVGPLSAVLVLAPLFVARWAFAQYAEQRAAHERTVAALVQAVEAKDRYTSGHSERVARASVLMAQVLRMSQQRTSTLHVAGMLHDIGKIGVPTRVLKKTGALTDAEFAAIARHPVQGLEVVREIEFLGEAFEGILHHHERLDGRGYPLGLVGEDIPEFARIIAVADAFDSMTSTRSYRRARSVDGALTELRNCAGSQFDHRFIDALADGLRRTPWESAPGAEPAQQDVRGEEMADGVADDGMADGGMADDHDDPSFGRYRRSDPSRAVSE